VKIAFVAPPTSEDIPTLPPLPLAYAAAILEQQRHIVRVYDLALCGNAPLADALAPLCTFRPHIIAIASDQPQTVASIQAMLPQCAATIVHLAADLRVFVSGQPVVRVIWQNDEQHDGINEQNVIFNCLHALGGDLDLLPFPARHLLALEQYPLHTPTGDLQTTLLAGRSFGDACGAFRSPKQIVAEMHSIAREHGIRHMAFVDLSLTHNLAWLHEMLYDLAAADLGIGWEGRVWHQHLTPDLLCLFQKAGCEILGLQFQAAEVLDSRAKRAALSAAVDQAHKLGMLVRAHIVLAPPYDAIPALVDLSATFSLDEVQFRVGQQPERPEPAEQSSTSPDEVAEMAHSRYRSRRSRQYFIERFGPQLGPMLWRVGRAGLLGRTWQRYADGGMADPASI